MDPCRSRRHVARRLRLHGPNAQSEKQALRRSRSPGCPGTEGGEGKPVAWTTASKRCSPPPAVRSCTQHRSSVLLRLPSRSGCAFGGRASRRLARRIAGSRLPSRATAASRDCDRRNTYRPPPERHRRGRGTCCRATYPPISSALLEDRECNTGLRERYRHREADSLRRRSLHEASG